ncbi:hypothetical protein Lal_00011466 [Lupinus albus]|uniref:PSII 6.1 kDa protein n=1 Tax=Lupinus albus TaxID=3870 RepID=A0A6A5N833_LUPAL|nr:putative photosystem II PsbW, class 2 [Lupinus albus]KAF1880408.1 hypothetical protein Lal_00011466 [Lupinus albus]
MTTMSATIPTSSITHACLVQKRPLGLSYSHILGLAAMCNVGRVSWSMKGKACVEEKKSKMGMGASMIGATLAATMSSPAMALVDERLSTEGTGLPFGLSNNLLGWILFGVFGLIWTLYFLYVSGLDEDEDSGLSL